MTGHGSRFKAEGFERLKPFVKVQGKTMIEWIVLMFKGDEANIVFVCRQEHLDELDYVKRELKEIAPEA